MENNTQLSIEEVNSQLEIMARNQLQFAIEKISQEEQKEILRLQKVEQIKLFEADVIQVLNSFNVIDKVYIDAAIKNFSINGIETELVYKPNGLIGIKLHFGNGNLSSSDIDIFNKLGQSIRYFFDLGVPLLCDIPINFKSLILTITKNNTNDTIPAHIEGPDYLFVYTADTLEQRIKFKKFQISVERIIANNSGVTFKTKTIATDVKSLEDINAITNYIALIGTKPATLTQWKATDNTYVSIDSVEDWKDLVKVIAETFQSNFETAQNKKSLLLTVTTQEQLDAI